MNQHHTALLKQLSQAVEQFKACYHAQGRQVVYAKFDPMVFSENFQSVDFYLKELDYSLAQLSQLNDQNLAQTIFLTEKLLAQCTALSDALAKSEPQENRYSHSTQPKLSLREQRKAELDKLPPRERLEKYYDALKALNDKLNEQKDLLAQAQSDMEQLRYRNLIEQTRTRRQRCLEAIEILEEYLAFKDAQE
ncbi:MAG: primosomal replication protein [Actinobacillus porcinus]|uniref:primosomal replication protein n=1 Tax=Actinobacillus porcinus TaxID=51048 RepID=UPI00235562B4|nr:primosomal replication protein [Actinobacillus porcinus]MCI5764606.1 primosomal replication protein [Actinobacillus porcinus]